MRVLFPLYRLENFGNPWRTSNREQPMRYVLCMSYCNTLHCLEAPASPPILALLVLCCRERWWVVLLMATLLSIALMPKIWPSRWGRWKGRGGRKTSMREWKGGREEQGRNKAIRRFFSSDSRHACTDVWRTTQRGMYMYSRALTHVHVCSEAYMHSRICTYCVHNYYVHTYTLYLGSALLVGSGDFSRPRARQETLMREENSIFWGIIIEILAWQCMYMYIHRSA